MLVCKKRQKWFLGWIQGFGLVLELGKWGEGRVCLFRVARKGGSWEGASVRGMRLWGGGCILCGKDKGWCWRAGGCVLCG